MFRSSYNGAFINLEKMKKPWIKAAFSILSSAPAILTFSVPKLSFSIVEDTVDPTFLTSYTLCARDSTY